jgi:UDP-hydrolysing UDP-N-acetyl-D-glucosamine 2-epimerase
MAPQSESDSLRIPCIVSGSRADFGLLEPVLAELDSRSVPFDLLLTGSHLSRELGNTASAIVERGWKIRGKVESLLASDSRLGTAKSMGLGMLGFAEWLEQLKPSVLMVLGDRFEVFAACATALVLGIPIAHIAGGDVTEGAFDDALRHSISKMSTIHFATNESARQRLIRMGEIPETIFTVGSPGLDTILATPVLTLLEVEKAIGHPLGQKNALVTFHPATLGADSRREVDQLLQSLEGLPAEFAIWITLGSADPGSQELAEAFYGFARHNPGTVVQQSLGSLNYINLARVCDVVIGNSSSGLYEMPFLGVPTVNIGSRQKGRLKAESVFDCSPEAESISAAIRKALEFGRVSGSSPYGDGESAKRIVDVLTATDFEAARRSKRFYESDQKF